MEAVGFRNLKVKHKVKKEYFRWMKKILESRLNSGNVVKMVNSRVVAVIRYYKGLRTWTKDKLIAVERQGKQ